MYLANISTIKVGRTLAVEAASPWVPEAQRIDFSSCVIYTRKWVGGWDAIIPIQSQGSHLGSACADK